MHSDGTADGFSVDLLKEVAQTMGMSICFHCKKIRDDKGYGYDEGIRFIQKQFSMKDIVVKIQNVLESADANYFKNHTELIKEK